MGQHTWFVKNIDVLKKERYLSIKSEQLYNEGQYLESEFIEDVCDKLYEFNELDDYHDVFRCYKRNEDNTYTDIILSSMKETTDFIIDPNNYCYTDDGYYIQLKEFWNKYPKGAIYFG